MPELLPWTANDRTPDVEIISGEIPDIGPTASAFGPAIKIAGDGGVRLEIPTVGVFFIEGGHRVTIAAVPGVSESDVRVFLLGTVLGVLCYRWGLLPLHAAGVAVKGGALLVTGDSGAGKSILVAALAARGFPLIADDLCALDFSDKAAPKILPAFPRLKLWADSATRLGIPVEGLERCRAATQKFALPFAAERFHAAALPPKSIVLLYREPLRARVGTQRLSGMAAVARRNQIVYCARLGDALGYAKRIFQGFTELLNAAPLYETARSDRFDDLAALCDRATEAVE